MWLKYIHLKIKSSSASHLSKHMLTLNNVYIVHYSYYTYYVCHVWSMTCIFSLKLRSAEDAYSRHQCSCMNVAVDIII